MIPIFIISLVLAEYIHFSTSLFGDQGTFSRVLVLDYIGVRQHVKGKEHEKHRYAANLC